MCVCVCVCQVKSGSGTHLLENCEGFLHGAGTAMAVYQVLPLVTQNKQNIKHLLLQDKTSECVRERVRERGGGRERERERESCFL